MCLEFYFYKKCVTTSKWLRNTTLDSEPWVRGAMEVTKVKYCALTNIVLRTGGSKSGLDGLAFKILGVQKNVETLPLLGHLAKKS